MSGKILDTAVPELNYRRNIIGDSLTPDLVQELQGYGALEWSPRDIAISMGFDIDQFTAEYKDPDSTVSLIITRGRLQAQADISKKVFENAKLGDLPSILHLEKIRRENRFKPRNSTSSAASTIKSHSRRYPNISRPAEQPNSPTTRNYSSTCFRSLTPWTGSSGSGQL